MFFETTSHLARLCSEAGLELWSSCLYPPRARITAVHLSHLVSRVREGGVSTLSKWASYFLPSRLKVNVALVEKGLCIRCGGRVPGTTLHGYLHVLPCSKSGERALGHMWQRALSGRPALRPEGTGPAFCKFKGKPRCLSLVLVPRSLPALLTHQCRFLWTELYS